MLGSAVRGLIVWTPAPGILKQIVPPARLASVIAWRNEHGVVAGVVDICNRENERRGCDLVDSVRYLLRSLPGASRGKRDWSRRKPR